MNLTATSRKIWNNVEQKNINMLRGVVGFWIRRLQTLRLEKTSHRSWNHLESPGESCWILEGFRAERQGSVWIQTLEPGTKSWSRASLLERTKRSPGTGTRTGTGTQTHTHTHTNPHINTQCEGSEFPVSQLMLNVKWFKVRFVKMNKQTNKPTSAGAAANLHEWGGWRGVEGVEVWSQQIRLWPSEGILRQDYQEGVEEVESYGCVEPPVYL